MASITEAFDSTIKEPFTGIKIILWAIPLSIVSSSNNKFVTTVFIPLLFILVLGYVVDLGHNVISKKGVIVPGIDLKSMFLTGFVALLSLSPYLLFAFIVFMSLTFFNLPWELWDKTLKIVLSLFAISIPLTALAILIRRKNVLEVYNPVKMLQGFGEIYLSFSFFLVKMAVWTAIIIGFLSLVFSIFIGFNNSFWHYITIMYAFVFITLAANMVAQISEEIYSFREAEENKIKMQKEMDKLK